MSAIESSDRWLEPKVGDAALRFAAEVMGRHGVVQSNGLVKVELSSRRLAKLVGKSPGTVSGYMRELGDAGVRVDGDLFDPSVLERCVGPTTPLSVRREQPRRSAGSDQRVAMGALVDLVQAAPQELEQAQAIASRLLAAVAGVEVQNEDRECAGSVSNPRISRAETRAVFDSKDAKRVSNEGMNTSFIPSGSSECAETRAVDPRGPRTRTEFELLLAPLVKAASEAGIEGPTYLKGLADQWSDASNDHVCFAVSRLTDEVRAGLRKPFGKLHNCRHDPLYCQPVGFDLSPPPVEQGEVEQVQGGGWIEELADAEPALDRADGLRMARQLKRDHQAGVYCEVEDEDGE